MHKSIKIASILILFVSVVLLRPSFGQHAVHILRSSEPAVVSHTHYKSPRVCSGMFLNSRLAFVFQGSQL